MTLRIQVINRTDLSDIVALDCIRIMAQGDLDKFDVSGPTGKIIITRDIREKAGTVYYVNVA